MCPQGHCVDYCIVACVVMTSYIPKAAQAVAHSVRRYKSFSRAYGSFLIFRGRKTSLWPLWADHVIYSPKCAVQTMSGNAQGVTCVLTAGITQDHPGSQPVVTLHQIQRFRLSLVEVGPLAPLPQPLSSHQSPSHIGWDSFLCSVTSAPR